MQINLLDPRIKNFFKSYLGWILFFLMVWFNGCSGNETKTVKVIVPAVTGKLETKKPESKPIEINQEPISEVKKDGLVYVENPLNKKLVEENKKLKSDYSKMSDSLKSKAYDKAIELNTFSYKSEDKYLKLTIDGIVRGEVQQITPIYEIKEREAEAVVKQTYLRVLAGGAVGINKDLNQGVYKLDVDFQNQKGDMLSAEYLRVNNQDYGMIGFKKSILNLKR